VWWRAGDALLVLPTGRDRAEPARRGADRRRGHPHPRGSRSAGRRRGRPARRLIETNLTAPILLTRDLLPALRRAKGVGQRRLGLRRHRLSLFRGLFGKQVRPARLLRRPAPRVVGRRRDSYIRGPPRHPYSSFRRIRPSGRATTDDSRLTRGGGAPHLGGRRPRRARGLSPRQVEHLRARATALSKAGRRLSRRPGAPSRTLAALTAAAAE